MTLSQQIIQIRYAIASDNILLADFGAQTYYDTFAVDNTPENMMTYLSTAFNPQKQAQELADPMIKFLIAESDGATMGYAKLKFGHAAHEIIATKPMEIARFYARKESIGKGVGAQLMQACLAEAKQNDCDVVWLDVWERNPRAIAFYRKWGFAQVGTQSFQLGDDLQHDWLMARKV